MIPGGGHHHHKHGNMKEKTHRRKKHQRRTAAEIEREYIVRLIFGFYHDNLINSVHTKNVGSFMGVKDR